MRRISVCLGAVGLMLVASVAAKAATVTFTPAQIKSVMASQGAPLSDANNQWGLWAVRARPIIPGGSFTVTNATTNQQGWGTTAPSSFSWNTYGTNCAWFWDTSGSEAGSTAANPLHMIMDVADENWWSSAFDKNGDWVDDWAPGPDETQGTGDDLGTFYTSGYDNGAGGTNVITAVDDTSVFSFDFDVDSGTWNGAWEFLVDGSKYELGTAAAPGGWEDNFFGAYGTGGDLTGNTGTGYVIPEPASIAVWSLIAGLGLGFGSWRRRRD